jgi:AcrR family transcriptional regulator
MRRVRQTLRDRKKEQTRRQIADAALVLMARDGYGATTMAAIADAAGVSRRTVFRYFADKEEVVFADDPHHIGAILAAVDEAPPDLPPLVVMRRAGLAFAAEIGRSPKEIGRWTAIVGGEPALQARYLAKQRRWEERITERLATRGHADPQLSAKIGIACVQAAFDGWASEPAGHSLAARVEAAFDALPALVG